MAKYFSITTGLRGCYADGEHVSYHMVTTRRALRTLIASEADFYAAGSMIGNSKRAVSSVAADAWRAANSRKPPYLPLCLPLKPEHGSSYSHGVFVSVETRADYLEYVKEMENA